MKVVCRNFLLNLCTRDELRAGYVSEAVKQAHLVMDTATESQRTRTVVEKCVGADTAFVGPDNSGGKEECMMNKKENIGPLYL